MDSPALGSFVTPKRASDVRGATMLPGASQILSASNRRLPFLLLHRLSTQRQHLEKHKARVQHCSEAILKKTALVDSQMARLLASLGIGGCESPNPTKEAPAQASPWRGINPSPKLKRGSQLELKEVRHRY
jgi:hypothetical protein